MSALYGTRKALETHIQSFLEDYLGDQLISLSVAEERHTATVNIWEDSVEVSELIIKINLKSNAQVTYRVFAVKPRSLADRTPGYEGWNPAEYKIDLDEFLTKFSS